MADAGVDAPDIDAPLDAPPVNSLTVVRGGGGMGTVTSSPAGIDCGATCTTTVETGTLVTLTATPATGATFTGWGGECAGSLSTCSVIVSADSVVNADFAVALIPVEIAVAGTGTGTVASAPTGIDCPGSCTDSFEYGQTVRLIATPGPSSYFMGWTGGGCTGTGDCTVTATAAANVTATFGPLYTLTAAKAGTGSGTVASGEATPLIDCGADCSEIYQGGAMVTLTATPGTDSNFTSWTGACTGAAATCTVTVTAAATATATFTLKTHLLTVTKMGTAAGTVSSSPAGISNCGGATSPDCTQIYNHGTNVTLTATPAMGGNSLFTGWAGDCSGVGTCTVGMDAAKNVTAIFDLPVSGLNITRTGTGSGTVVSNPAGINCGADCSEPFTSGTTVALTATATTGSTFTGWSGGICSGTAGCTFAMPATTTTVTAQFTLNTYALTVSKVGLGTVASNPAGIDCGADCSETLGHGSTVTLTATPATGYSFTGWTGGGCTGTGTCTVTMTAATAVTATFTINSYTLTVSKGTSTGFGTVSSSPAGISCGIDCTQDYTHGTMITLAAAPATSQSQLSVFSGWSGGGCTGTGGCTVTLTAATTVTALFTIKPNFAFLTTDTYSGNLGGTSGADAKCKDAAINAGLAGSYKAWIATSTESADAHIGTASGWVRTDGKIFARSKADFVAGRHHYPLRVSETGVDLLTARTAWTGALMTGAATANTCSNWTSIATGTSGTAGEPHTGGTMWSSFSTSGCTGLKSLYCLGVDRVAPIAAPAPAAGRIAFVSSASFNASTGVAGADALCTSQATAAGLTGTFKALLATTTATAASRFTTTAANFVRPDGVVIGPVSAVLGGNVVLSAPINVTADAASYLGNNGSWTGATAPTSVGTAASTCANWSSNLATATGVYGRVGETDGKYWFNTTTTTTCNASFRVYCLQN